MIAVLKGGLGNQMFQYAFGRSVAKVRNEEVVFTRNIPDSDPKRCYGLGVFADPIAFVSDVREPCLYEWNNTYGFNPQVYDKHWVSFDGQWQTEKYFDSPLVHTFFKPQDLMSDETKRVAAEILALGSRSAFLHVRRSDYLDGTSSGRPNSDWHPTMTREYYNAGRVIVRAHQPEVTWFVFSDDPEWCRHEFPGYRVVDHNKPGGRLFGKEQPGQEHEDLWLMSLCRHAVIANSTFSWWGAWMGDEQPGRVVIGPKKWFGPALAQLETKDILPERWMKVDL